MDDLPGPSLLEKSRTLMTRWRVDERAESLYPWILAMIAGATAWYSPLSDTERKDVLDGVIEPAISVASILAGFQATALTVLLSVTGSEAVKFLKKAGKYDLLLKYIVSSFIGLVLFVLVAFVVLAAEKAGNSAVLGRTTYATLAVLFTFALVASYRISILMIKLLKSKQADITTDTQ